MLSGQCSSTLMRSQAAKHYLNLEDRGEEGSHFALCHLCEQSGRWASRAVSGATDGWQSLGLLRASHPDGIAATIGLFATSPDILRMRPWHYHAPRPAITGGRLVHSRLLTGESYSSDSTAVWCPMLDITDAPANASTPSTPEAHTRL
jgi:hypothetical protein